MKEVFLPQTDIGRWMSIADFPNEIWKDVIGFEDAFQVSNLGRIKRKAFNFNIFNGVNSFRKAHILKPQLRVGGYYHVSLSYKGKVYTKLVHRLVAMAFIPNPYNLPQINHKDECKTNNSVLVNLDGSIDFEKSNLEWCDNKYNSNYGTKGQRIAEKLSCPVQKYGTDGILICEYPSAMEASRQTGLSVSRIVDCCNGRKKSVTGGGYFWKYKDSDKVILAKPKIIQISTNGQIINVWDKISLAAKALKICPTSICNCISGLSKKAGGYIWKKE